MSIKTLDIVDLGEDNILIGMQWLRKYRVLVDASEGTILPRRQVSQIAGLRCSYVDKTTS